MLCNIKSYVVNLATHLPIIFYFIKSLKDSPQSFSNDGNTDKNILFYLKNGCILFL